MNPEQDVVPVKEDLDLGDEPSTRVKGPIQVVRDIRSQRPA